ncbi:MAG: ABC transporter permease, partial [Deltaproteobacteria bacterium]
MIPQLIGVYLLLFLVLRVAGTDPAYLYLPKHATPEEIAAFRHEKGLDKPLWYQCLSGMKDLVTLDLGYSWSSKEPVSKMFLDGVGPSVALTLPALLLYTLISIALGLICAYWRGTLIDKTIIVLATVGMAISYVAVMIFAQYFLAFLPSEYGHPIFPVIGYESGFDWVYLLDRIPVMPWPRNLRYIVLPTLISTFVALGYDTRFFRSIAVEEINRDYIRTAKAYGATTRTILFKHVLKNIMIPIIARVVVTLPFLIT